MSWKFACEKSAVEEEGMVEVEIDGATVLIVHSGGEFYAIPPACPHMEEPLKTGVCANRTITCIKHLWQWNLDDGEPMGPAETPIMKYETRTSDTAVEIFFEKELTYTYEDS